jgi:hypothetical protein
VSVTSLSFTAAVLLMAQQAEPAAGSPTIVLPLVLPQDRSLIVEHVDERRLPDGSEAVFRQQHLLLVHRDDDGTILDYRKLSSTCGGPAAICDAFRVSVGPQPGPVYRYRLGASGELTLLGQPQAPVEAVSTAATVINEREAETPGAVLAADLRLLIRFANLALPSVIGESVTLPEGQLMVNAISADAVGVQVDRPARSAESDMALSSRVTCHIVRATGMIDRCEMLDWLDATPAQPVRRRTVTVRLASGPVS